MADATTDSSPWWRDEANLASVRHYAHMSGLLYRSRVLKDNSAVNITVTLQPWRYPEELFQLVWDVQPDLNAAIDAMSRDLKFLEEALERCVVGYGD